MSDKKEKTVVCPEVKIKRKAYSLKELEEYFEKKGFLVTKTEHICPERYLNGHPDEKAYPYFYLNIGLAYYGLY